MRFRALINTAWALPLVMAWTASDAAAAASAAGAVEHYPLQARHCPPQQAPVVEHFINAECTECWAGTDRGDARTRASGHQRGWRLDWITPTHDAAAMAVAALPEAAERQARRASRDDPPLSALDAAHRSTRRAAGHGSLTVQTGPAWAGYLGTSVRIDARPGSPGVPNDSTAWLALVEWVPAGQEGNVVDRQLVRAVAGPLALPRPGQKPTEHLRAMRWPENSRAERLTARAWIEGPDGRVLRMAADRCPPG